MSLLQGVLRSTTVDAQSVEKSLGNLDIHHRNIFSPDKDDSDDDLVNVVSFYLLP